MLYIYVYIILYIYIIEDLIAALCYLDQGPEAVVQD